MSKKYATRRLLRCNHTGKQCTYLTLVGQLNVKSDMMKGEVFRCLATGSQLISSINIYKCTQDTTYKRNDASTMACVCS